MCQDSYCDLAYSIKPLACCVNLLAEFYGTSVECYSSGMLPKFSRYERQYAKHSARDCRVLKLCALTNFASSLMMVRRAWLTLDTIAHLSTSMQASPSTREE